MRHLENVTAQAQHAEDHHEDGSNQRDFGGTGETVVRHGFGNERDGDGGGAPD